MRRIRREHANARERYRTHANTLAVCNIVIQQIHTTWTLDFDILLTYTFSQTNVRTRKQTTLRQRSATSKAQKQTNERRNMNTMESSSFYDDNPAFASPLHKDEFMLLEDDTERDALLDQEDVFMEDVPPLSTPEPLEIDNVHSSPTTATRDDHIKPSISNWAYVRINPERFVPPPEVAPLGQVYSSEVVGGKVYYYQVEVQS